MRPNKLLFTMKTKNKIEEGKIPSWLRERLLQANRKIRPSAEVYDDDSVEEEFLVLDNAGLSKYLIDDTNEGEVSIYTTRSRKSKTPLSKTTGKEKAFLRELEEDLLLDGGYTKADIREIKLLALRKFRLKNGPKSNKDVNDMIEKRLKSNIKGYGRKRSSNKKKNTGKGKK